MVQEDASLIEYEWLDSEDILFSDFVKVVKSFGAESGLEKEFEAPLDVDHFQGFLAPLMDQGMGHVAAAMRQGDVIGALVFLVVKHPFTGLDMAQEFMWYILPKYRNGRAGAKLFRMYEDKVKELQVELASTAFLEASMPEKVAKFYERKGYQKVETSHVKRVWQ